LDLLTNRTEMLNMRCFIFTFVLVLFLGPCEDMTSLEYFRYPEEMSLYYHFYIKVSNSPMAIDAVRRRGGEINSNGFHVDRGIDI
jgi:hypothetical protein